MTRTALILLTTLTLLSACRRSPQPEKNSNMVNTLDTAVNDIAQKTQEIQEASNTKAVQTIIVFIDSLYDLKESQTIDTITDWTSPGNQDYELGPKGLDLTDLDKYYHYVSFDFLLFRDKTAAKKQFDRVVESGSHKRLDRSDPNQVLYWKIFSKAGSAYTLYDDMIIYHHRRCNYNEKIEIPREDRLLAYLFDDKRPEDTHFVRVRCGWGRHEKE